MRETTKKAMVLILDSIQHEDTPTLAYILGRFNSEYGWLIQQKGLVTAGKEWMQGLALHVPYMNHEVEAMGFKADMGQGEYWYELGVALAMLDNGISFKLYKDKHGMKKLSAFGIQTNGNLPSLHREELGKIELTQAHYSDLFNYYFGEV